MGAALAPILEGGAVEAGGAAAAGGEVAAAEGTTSRVGSFGMGQNDGNKAPEGAPKKGRENLNNWFPGAGLH
jgi:hypothetical protein